MSHNISAAVRRCAGSRCWNCATLPGGFQRCLFQWIRSTRVCRPGSAFRLGENAGVQGCCHLCILQAVGQMPHTQPWGQLPLSLQVLPAVVTIIAVLLYPVEFRASLKCEVSRASSDIDCFGCPLRTTRKTQPIIPIPYSTPVLTRSLSFCQTPVHQTQFRQSCSIQLYKYRYVYMLLADS